MNGKDSIIYIFIIIVLIIALGVVYFLGFVKNQDKIAKINSEKANLTNKLIELESGSISFYSSNLSDSNNSSESSISLHLGKYVGKAMDDDIDLSQTVFGGADDFSIILKDNNMCNVYEGYGNSNLGVYKIENNKLICNTIIQKGEEGGIAYKESNTIFEYEIVDSNTIKLVNIYGDNSNTDNYARKIGRTFTFSN